MLIKLLVSCGVGRLFTTRLHCDYFRLWGPSYLCGSYSYYGAVKVATVSRGTVVVVFESLLTHRDSWWAPFGPRTASGKTGVKYSQISVLLPIVINAMTLPIGFCEREGQGRQLGRNDTEAN